MTPDTHTIQESFLEVGDGHTLYVHDWGNKHAKHPIMVLHGGPGDSSSDSSKTRFNPKQHRVIFFDQRGCGRSTPYGSIEHNTTQDLISDITKIADHCKLDRFVLTGGSWGSCLALAYAIAHPERVHALLLNGIFTGSQAEINWIDKGMFQTFYPEVWQQYLEATPQAHHANPTAYHTKRVLGSNEDAMRDSAYTYGSMEAAVLALDDRFTPPDIGTFDPLPARIELHYITNRCFMPDRFVFDNAHRLTMPVWLVQGRYDMVCPPQAAHQLHAILPNSQLIWTIGGHRSGDRETATALKTLALQWR